MIFSGMTLSIKTQKENHWRKKWGTNTFSHFSARMKISQLSFFILIKMGP